MLETTLTRVGYNVLIVANGPDALEALSDGQVPDLLLTDVVLPGGLSGPELARRLLEEHPKMPVLYMSGYTQNVVSQGGGLDPNITLLRKPFRQRDLLQSITKALLDS